MKNITFFNAGAGSGKTYHLTMTLSQVIRDGICKADEVILTTFTEAAAAEFKAKARETLHKEQMHDQANMLSSAIMGTVHSVAHQLIRKYWHYLGSGVDLRVMPKEDASFFISQSLAYIPSEKELADLFEITENLDFRDDFDLVDYSRWQRDLNKVIEVALSNKIEILEDSKSKSLEETLELFKPVDFSADVMALDQILKRLTIQLPMNKENAANSKRLSKARHFSSLGGKYTLKDLFGIQALFNDLPKRDKDRIPEINDLLYHLSSLPRSTALVNYMVKYIDLIFTLADRSIERYRKYKEENKLIDFNDMEIMFLKLLEIEQVKEEMKSRYKVVFVDEFQDSSPIQVDIFIKLSNIMKHSYWVGDPKQAIYDFRGTDPALIDAVIAALEQGKAEYNYKVKNLEDSWRSRPQIVHLTSKIFASALADQVDKDHVALVPVRPADELPDDNRHHALQHWHFDDDNSRGSYDLMAKHLATEISSIVRDEHYQVVDKYLSRYDKEHPDQVISFPRRLVPEDIAVLCHKNDRVKTFAGGLRKAGLEVSAEQKGLLKTAEMQLFLAMLNYYLDPLDSLARSTILLLCGQFEDTEHLIDDRLELLKDISIDEESGLNERDEHDTQEMERYYAIQRSWGAGNSILKVIEEYIRPDSAYLSVRGITEKIITQSGLLEIVLRWDYPLQRRQNIETIRALAAKYEERCLLMDMGASITGFISYISNFDDRTLLQGSASGREAVNIITYHGSKGLEWPVVILADLEENHLAEDKLIQKSYFGVSTDQQGNIDIFDPYRGKSIVMIPYPFGSRGVPVDLRNDVVITPRFERIKRNVGREMKRLLYVGMTRARDMLITVSYKNKELHWLHSVLEGIHVNTRIRSITTGHEITDLFGTGDPVLVKTFNDQGSECDAKAETTSRQIRVYQKTGPVVQDKPFHRSPSMEAPLEKVKAEVLHDYCFRIDVGKGLQERENELGNCMHRAFFLYVIGNNQQEYIMKAAQVIKEHGLEGDIPHPEHLLISIENLYDFLERSFGKPVKIYKELPLQFFEEGKLFTGSADLLWETEKGLVLVDYKASPVRKEHLLNPEHEKFAGKYSGQLSRYAQMINQTHPAGKQVKDTLIYYALNGMIVKLHI